MNPVRGAIGWLLVAALPAVEPVLELSGELSSGRSEVTRLGETSHLDAQFDLQPALTVHLADWPVSPLIGVKAGPAIGLARDDRWRYLGIGAEGLLGVMAGTRDLRLEARLGLGGGWWRTGSSDEADASGLRPGWSVSGGCAWRCRERVWVGPWFSWSRQHMPDVIVEGWAVGIQAAYCFAGD